MKSALRNVILAFAAIALTSCFQNSTVVRVSKDGSGAIFARNYASPQAMAMMGGIAGSLTDLGGEGAGANSENPFKPTKEEIEKGAASYGEGVRYSKHEEVKNAQGWEGYVVVYEFDDISKVSFDPNNPPGPLNEVEEMDPDAEPTAEGALVTFTMEDGLLTINTGVSKESLSELADSGDLDDLEGGEDPAEMKMMAGMLAGMRMGTFVRIDGTIAETNATHVNGTMITLSDMEMAKAMGDPKFVEVTKFINTVDQAVEAGETSDATAEDVVKMMNTVDGVTMEAQEKITVKIE